MFGRLFAGTLGLRRTTQSGTVEPNTDRSKQRRATYHGWSDGRPWKQPGPAPEASTPYVVAILHQSGEVFGAGSFPVLFAPQAQ